MSPVYNRDFTERSAHILLLSETQRTSQPKRLSARADCSPRGCQVGAAQIKCSH